MLIGSAFPILGIGAFCVLICRLAVDAFPAFVGSTVGFWAYSMGAGPIGAIILALIAGATTLAAGRLAFNSSHNQAVRLIILALFAAPAMFAGYHLRAGFGAPDRALRGLAACVRRNGRAHYRTDRSSTAYRL
jgi:hypothetical protein